MHMESPIEYQFAHSYQPSMLKKFLSNLLALEKDELKSDDDPTPFERQRRPITKGDPREFVG